MSYTADSVRSDEGAMREMPPPSLPDEKHISGAKGHHNVHPAERVVSSLAGAALATYGAISAAGLPIA